MCGLRVEEKNRRRLFFQNDKKFSRCAVGQQCSVLIDLDCASGSLCHQAQQRVQVVQVHDVRVRLQVRDGVAAPRQGS